MVENYSSCLQCVDPTLICIHFFSTTLQGCRKCVCRGGGTLLILKAQLSRGDKLCTPHCYSLPPPQIFKVSDIPASDMYATFTLGEKCVVSSKGNVSRAELNSRQNLSLMSSIQTNMQLLKIGLSQYEKKIGHSNVGRQKQRIMP